MFQLYLTLFYFPLIFLNHINGAILTFLSVTTSRITIVDKKNCLSFCCLISVFFCFWFLFHEIKYTHHSVSQSDHIAA